MTMELVTPEQIDKEVEGYFISPDIWAEVKSKLRVGDKIYDYDDGHTNTAGIIVVRDGQSIIHELRVGT